MQYFHSGGEQNYVLSGEPFAPANEEFEESFTGTEFHETHTLIADGGDRFGVSTATFDTMEELMWMGNQGVRPIISRSQQYNIESY